jgi:hypothetical protein
MANLNLSLGRLAQAGYTPAEIVRIMQALDLARIHVNLQVKGPDGIKLLGQLTASQKQQENRSRFRIASLLVIGVLGSLTVLTFGLLGLF